MPHCPVCKNTKNRVLFSKESALGNPYTIVICQRCSTEFISPLPEQEELNRYYEKNYFMNRTDRGYNNYFSDGVRTQVERVFNMNLADLDFDRFEAKLKLKNSLDIGCAAGYFVNLMKEKGWKARGIDVSQECTGYGSETLGLDIDNGDYLQKKYDHTFQLITLWATIEHLTAPDLFLKKIHNDLDDGGMIILSTCRSDSLFKKIFGKRWRYYNVPEHVFYGTRHSLKLLLENQGFVVEKIFTYGSGFGRGGTLARKTADTLAKKLGLGDMIVISARKKEQP